MGKKDKNIPGRCVFCDGTGLSKEHIVSDWLSAHLSTQAKHVNTRITVARDPTSGDYTIIPEMREFQGPFHRRKVRKVCTRCNGGWMSRIVSRAKPAVLAMVENIPTTIERKSLRDVAAWIALMATMAEFIDEPSSGVTVEERKVIWEKEEPPANWTIFTGRYDGTTWSPSSRRRHHGHQFHEPLLPGPIRIESTPVKKLQITTIALKFLLIHCSSSTSARVVSAFRRRWQPPNMVTVWPPSAGDLQWPSTPPLGDAEAAEIADAFNNAFLANRFQ